ncbi:(2Fe-2S) ferredoxin domain-containing protein [Phormidium tenue FACHB-886]|nr:(2Fe-2S) ferredoxin domain-containing protein [Phormidium tenue FACHB-886]
MTKLKFDSSTEFTLEGRFLGFAAEIGSYKLKYLRLATSTGEHHIKLSKELRSPLYRSLTPGMWVQVSGSQKPKTEGGVKLKAYQVTPANTKDASAASHAACLPTPYSLAQSPAEATVAKAGKPACILICQKSDCCKRGSQQVARALEAELSERGLQDQVTVKATGCMKRCKEGANVIMPDKTRYSRVRPGATPALLDKHFPESVPELMPESANASSAVAL